MGADYLFEADETQADPVVRVTKILDHTEQSAYEVRLIAGAWRCNCPAGKFGRTCKHVSFLQEVAADACKPMQADKARAELGIIEAHLREGGALSIKSQIGYDVETGAAMALLLDVKAPSYGEAKPSTTLLGFRKGLNVAIRVVYT